jgi:hypothetical protein
MSVRVGDRLHEHLRKRSLRLDVLEEEYKRAQDAYFAALYRAEKRLGLLGIQKRTRAQTSAINCTKCGASFSSNNKLHIHLRGRCRIVRPLNGDDNEPPQRREPPSRLEPQQLKAWSQQHSSPQPSAAPHPPTPPLQRSLARQYTPPQPPSSPLPQPPPPPPQPSPPQKRPQAPLHRRNVRHMSSHSSAYRLRSSIRGLSSTGRRMSLRSRIHRRIGLRRSRLRHRSGIRRHSRKRYRSRTCRHSRIPCRGLCAVPAVSDTAAVSIAATVYSAAAVCTTEARSATASGSVADLYAA